MQIKFYDTISPNNQMNKVLTRETTVQGHLILPINIENPELKVSADNVENLISYNYVAFTYGNKLRYYYVSSRRIENNIMYISLSEDALMTWRDDIKNSNAHIVRSNKGNVYLPDQMATVTNKTEWKYRKIGTLASKGFHYIMIKGGN